MVRRARSAITVPSNRLWPFGESNAFCAKPIRHQYDIESMRTRLLVSRWAPPVRIPPVGYGRRIVGSSRSRHPGYRLRLLA